MKIDDYTHRRVAGITFGLLSGANAASKAHNARYPERPVPAKTSQDFQGAAEGLLQGLLDIDTARDRRSRPLCLPMPDGTGSPEM